MPHDCVLVTLAGTLAEDVPWPPPCSRPCPAIVTHVTVAGTIAQTVQDPESFLFPHRKALDTPRDLDNVLRTHSFRSLDQNVLRPLQAENYECYNPPNLKEISSSKSRFPRSVVCRVGCLYPVCQDYHNNLKLVLMIHAPWTHHSYIRLNTYLTNETFNPKIVVVSQPWGTRTTSRVACDFNISPSNSPQIPTFLNPTSKIDIKP
ncbi:hypothetical protein L6452_28191 [Arctium lappa]|uniref:Uncharacterized protein n=1 Tax=Arctium lappa TaxID=4217 RepID=A0ACB8ZZ44_ARCLA|nr:hypothetical protein L6452_28191 [Arctium lappa]